MNKKRLLKVIKSIENTPDEEFDMKYWWGGGPYCQTVGCAIGNYCKDHPKSELKLAISNNCVGRDEVDYMPVCGFSTQDWNGNIRWEYSEYEAIAHHFDIDVEEAEYLFAPHHKKSENTKEAVIKRIQNFIKETK